MSSKFKPSVAGKSTIPYCQPGPPIPIPIIPLPPGTDPPYAPAWLIAYAHWYDSIAEPGPFIAEALQIHLSGPGPEWHGTTFPPYPGLAVTVSFDSAPSSWDVILAVHRSSVIMEQHTWEAVVAFSTDPLVIKPPPLITIPDLDEQVVEIYG